MKAERTVKGKIIQIFFCKKFNTTYIKEEIIAEQIPEEQLGIPEIMMSEPNANKMMEPITMQEFSTNIASLSPDKAGMV